ncbi:MAG: dihydrofolate reductase [Oscillospiraceae bacterium]|nr:dihydrofolate reductase [Oscillospiraceae bacterium]
MEAIVAVFSDWGIGSEGTQQVVLTADRKHFRELTAGAAVLVGRRTMQDFPGGQPLKGRENLVLTRQNISVPGATVVHSEQEAVEASARYNRCLVIGGASVYRQMMPWVDIVHITKIDLAPPSDSFFPNLDTSPDWTCAEEGPWLEENGVRYCFCTYRRNPCKEESSS